MISGSEWSNQSLCGIRTGCHPVQKLKIVCQGEAEGVAATHLGPKEWKYQGLCLAVWGVLWDSRLAIAVVVQRMGREVVGSLGCGWVGLGVGKGGGGGIPLVTLLLVQETAQHRLDNIVILIYR